MSIAPIQSGQTGISSPASSVAKQGAAAEKTGQAEAPESSIVEIKSGWELMLSRLWEIDDPDYDPPYVSHLERDSYSGKLYAFLDKDDRKLVAELYEYARDRGIDFGKVDMFAFQLASYKECPSVQPGYLGHVDKDGNFPEDAGQFFPEDEAIIQSILTSKAIKDTEVDHGFLNFILNRPDRRGTFDFAFLRDVVFMYSTSGSDGSADPDAVVPLRPYQIVEQFKQSARDRGWDVEKESLNHFLLREEGVIKDEKRVAGESGAFGKYATRINGIPRAFLTDDDKSLLGLAYANAEAKGEKLERIDRLANELALLRMQQSTEEKLLESARKKPSDKKSGLQQQLEKVIDTLKNEA